MNTPYFSLNFFIKAYKENSKGLVPILARIMINEEKTELSINRHIKKSQWNQKTQKIIDHPDADQQNAYLQEMRSRIFTAQSKLYIAQEEITGEKIKMILKGKRVSKTHKLISVTKEHNNHFESQIGIKYSYGSYKNYKTTLSYFIEFVRKYYQMTDISIENVDYKFCQNYYKFLTSDKTCNNNGANKHIQRLKKIINYSVKMGYIQSNKLLAYSLKFIPYNRTKLSKEDIDKLQKLELNNASLKDVLNIFIFQCYTGLSYSDVKNITRKNIVIGVDGKRWINMVRTKTKQIFNVPLLAPAEYILNKYLLGNSDSVHGIFPVISNQKMNDKLKVIAEIADIDVNLTCHIARHTFATTVTLQEGVPIETVSKMLGHSNLRTTQIYATVTELKISKDMERLNK